MKEMCMSVSDFYMKIINNKHTLLYNRPAIHSIQRYNGLCELTNSEYHQLNFLRPLYTYDLNNVSTIFARLYVDQRSYPLKLTT